MEKLSNRTHFLKQFNLFSHCIVVKWWANSIWTYGSAVATFQDAIPPEEAQEIIDAFYITKKYNRTVCLWKTINLLVDGW